ncbi:MAG: M1 family aminopeptidase [Steroidobacteraceae bacterium]
MRRVLPALCALLTFATWGARADEAPRGPLSDEVVPQRYELTFNIDPRQGAFSGNARIEVKIAAPTRRIWLHGRGLRVTSATLRTGGRTLALAYSEVDALRGVARLDAAEPIPAGAATLRIVYAADFQQGVSGIGRIVRGDESYAYTQMQPLDARRAFPGFDDPRFKTPFTVIVVAREGDRVIANAPLAAQRSIGGGLVRHEFAPTPPLPTYLLALAVGPLDVVQGKAIPAQGLKRAPIPLRGVATRGQGPKFAYALEHTPEIVLALEDYFGIPYPYGKLDQVASPALRGAMENAGAVFYGDGLLLLGNDPPPAQLRGFFAVASHELAHQWFGDLVTPAWWDDIWLNESFAQWMGLKTAHQLRPDLVPATSLTEEMLAAMDTDSRSIGRPIRQPIDDNTRVASAFDGITYSKGAGVLTMMESYMGPERFQRGVRAHLAAHEFGTATANDFFAAMARAAGDPAVIDAFRSFVEQPGLPLVTLARRADGQLAIAQSRYAPVGSTIEQGQRWKIPLCIRFYGERGERKRCTLMQGGTATLAVPGDIGAIEAVMPNADGAGYYRFALDARDAAALLARGASLPDREALVLADSIKGGFAAGRIQLATYLDAMAALATHPNRQVSTLLGLDLVDLMNRMADEPQRAALRRRLGDVYAPRLAAIGASLDAKRNATDAADVQLLRRSLLDIVALGARDPQLRAQLAAAAASSLKDPASIDSGLRDRVWAVGVQEQVPGVVDAMVAAVRSDDALARSQAAFALGSADDPDVGAIVQKIALDPAVPIGEVFGALSLAVRQPALRRATWDWVRQNFEALGARASVFAKPFLLQLGGQFCDPAAQAQVRDFGEAKVREIGAGELEVGRTVESIGLCAALKAAHGAEFEALVAR